MEKLRDMAGAIRELLFVGVLSALVLVVIFWPEELAVRLDKLGVEEIGVGSLTAKLRESNKLTLEAADDLADIALRVEELEASVKQEAGDSGGASNGAAELFKKLNTLNQKLIQASKTQQAVLVESDAKADMGSQLTGWIFLGKVQEDRTTWDASNRRTIQQGQPTIAGGQVLEITDDVYVRGEPENPGRYSSGKALGVLPIGQRVIALGSPMYSHARGGGWFLWLKVRPI